MPPSYDTVDIQHLKETANSAGYQIIQRRLGEMAQAKYRELQGDLDPYYTAKCRGYLEALGVVAELPAMLEAEMRRSAKD